MARGYELQRLGDSMASWIFCPAGLTAQSIVYSGGIGGDISFEHALVEKFGCQILLFDPSPTGAHTIQRPENQIPQFHYHAMALADHAGFLELGEPLDEIEGSYSVQNIGAPIQVPCTDLTTSMKRNGHARIDLLKLDVEGCEYGIIDDLLSRRIPIRQILVEYHHGALPGIRRSQTIGSILKLRAAGYKLLSQDGANHAFFREDA